MLKNNITARFSLFSALAVLLSTIISKVLVIAAAWASSDIMISDTVATVFRYGNELFALLAIALTVCASVYAHSYFGKKTCIRVSLVSLGALFIGHTVMYVYNVIFNNLSSAQLISGALSFIVEILFFCLIILLAILFSYNLAKKRDLCEKEGADSRYSPLKAAFIAAGVYFFVLIADLSATNVIPFFIKYKNPTPIEIKNIIADYLYYIFSCAVCFIFIIISFAVLRKITGKLKLKIYYQKKDQPKS